MKRILVLALFSILMYSAAYPDGTPSVPVSYDLSSQDLPSNFKAWFVDSEVNDITQAQEQTAYIPAKSLAFNMMTGTGSLYFFYYVWSPSILRMEVYADGNMSTGDGANTLGWEVSLGGNDITSVPAAFNHAPSQGIESWGCLPVSIETESVLTNPSAEYFGKIYIKITSVGE